MISHVSVCLLAHEEKGLISNTFCHAKREYSFSVRPIGCTPAFFFFYHVNDYGIKLCGVLRNYFNLSTVALLFEKPSG